MQLFRGKKIDFVKFSPLCPVEISKIAQNGDVFGSRPSSKGHGSSRNVTHFRGFAFTDSSVILTYFHHFYTVMLASFGRIKFGLRFLTRDFDVRECKIN